MTQPQPVSVPELDVEVLRCEIRKEYAEVAQNPGKGFHFHTGRPLARLLGYEEAWLEGVPERSIESFAGTGNPFAMGMPQPGERVVDVGCGAGIDSLIAARSVSENGLVIGIDMTPEMLGKARESAAEIGLGNLEVRRGHAEALPVDDGWADLVISNGVVNLCPDKPQVFREMFRVLRPGGRIQIGDIAVRKAVPDSAKRDINLWKG
jgi:SAM-dependent methyltransferase